MRFTDNGKFCILPIVHRGCYPENIVNAFGNLEDYDIETGYCPSSLGIQTNELLRSFSKEAEDQVRTRINEGKVLAIVGGAVPVTLAPISAWSDKLRKDGKELSVLMLNAYSNLGEPWLALPSSEDLPSTVVGRMRTRVDENKIVQVGVRSMSEEEKNKALPGMFDVYRIMKSGKGWNGVIRDDIVPLLADDVYVSCDLSVFDPSVVQSVSRPLPGGFAWFQIIQLLLGVFSSRNVVGFDVTGYNRRRNRLAPDAYLAAKLLYKMIAYKGKQLQG